jgi:hypothetical protein
LSCTLFQNEKFKYFCSETSSSSCFFGLGGFAAAVGPFLGLQDEATLLEVRDGYCGRASAHVATALIAADAGEVALSAWAAGTQQQLAASGGRLDGLAAKHAEALADAQASAAGDLGGVQGLVGAQQQRLAALQTQLGEQAGDEATLQVKDGNAPTKEHPTEIHPLAWTYRFTYILVWNLLRDSL